MDPIPPNLVILSSKDIPAELEERFFKMIGDIIDALEPQLTKIGPTDTRLFIGALSYVYAAMVTELIKERGFEVKEYIKMEMETFMRNVHILYTK